MKFKVGDIVKTIFGIGTIVEINEDNALSYLVYHELWNEGHNGNDIEKGKYEGEHCYWFYESDLKLIEITSLDIELNSTDVSVKAEYNSIQFKIMPDRYIINKGATILFWGDGTKTIVKRSKDDEYNKRLGFLTAYFQKTCGMSKTKANKYLDSLVDQENEKETKSKYKVGDKVKVIHTGNLYTDYTSWFEENNCEELAEYFDRHHYPDTSEIHKIVAIGTHEWNNEIIILAIKPLHGKKIYLIGEEGVKKV